MEAADKKFPDNELLRKLNTVLKDIEHCQKTSTELLSDSQKRYDGKHTSTFTLTVTVTCTNILWSFSESKMTLAELKTLVETMQNLPCVMTQLEEVQVRSLTEQINLIFFAKLIKCIQKSLKVVHLCSALMFNLCTV